MTKIKVEDVAFWIIILLIIAIALWLLSGSPPTDSALISVALFVAASEILLWRAMFSNDKRTEIGFIKLKNDLDKKHNELKSLITKK